MSITWNGVSSDTIGVIVEKIPNRYVPTRRFSPQQVAGRNGNVLLVDKAFPNVEQEYEVYLSAESQGLPSVARACAEWLMGPDGYCRLTDSYDTTVYREAFLMGGFDIENILNKFGRCTITFSCKPQKYLLTGDTPIEIPDGTTTTYTGDVAQFDVITGASITSLSTTITPTQDLHGYASPWPAGGGKNILPPPTSATAGASGTIADNNGVLTISTTGENVTFTIRIPEFTFAESGQKIELLNSFTNGTVYFLNGSTQIDYFTLSSVNRVVSESSMSALKGKTIDRYRILVNAQTLTNATFAMMVTDSSASALTAFSPYSNICPITGWTGANVYVGPTQDVADATTYAIDWTSEAGTVYGGTLDVVTGVLTVTHGVKTLNGSESWSWSANNNLASTSISGGVITNGTTQYNKYTQNSTFSDQSWAGRISVDGTIGMFYGASAIYAKYSWFTTAAEAKSFFTDNPTTVVYELATPLTYQLTPQEIQALVGTNNVWSSSGDVSVTVTTPLGGTVTNPTPFEARPLLEVSGVGGITINGKSIQILESVSDFEIDCETMEAEDNSKIYCMDFPELSGGENEIVSNGSITALTVTPRWWTL